MSTRPSRSRRTCTPFGFDCQRRLDGTDLIIRITELSEISVQSETTVISVKSPKPQYPPTYVVLCRYVVLYLASDYEAVAFAKVLTDAALVAVAGKEGCGLSPQLFVDFYSQNASGLQTSFAYLGDGMIKE